MSKKTSGERERFWQDLIERQSASGLSIARFCKQAGVSANSFFVWKRRLRIQDAGFGRRSKSSERSAASTHKRSQPRDRAASATSLIPVRLIADPIPRRAANAGAIEVEWPNGLVLRVPTGCDANTLRDVLQALRMGTDAEASPC
jgi:transposase-like protein